MVVKELVDRPDFTLLTGGEALNKRIERIFCCDLLSIAMSKASADCAWVTVMGNVNSIAVAVLTDMSCVILAEGAELDTIARAKAIEQNIAVFKTSLPVFDAAFLVHQLSKSSYD